MNRCLGNIGCNILEFKCINIKSAHVKKTNHLDMIFIYILSQSRIERQRICTVSCDLPGKPFCIFEIDQDMTPAAAGDRVGIVVNRIDRCNCDLCVAGSNISSQFEIVIPAGKPNVAVPAAVVIEKLNKFADFVFAIQNIRVRRFVIRLWQERLGVGVSI